MTAEMPQELIELLEKIVIQNSAFSNNPNLQNLLILTAIKADTTRVMDYINRLDAFNGPEVGEIAVGNELYEEAFAIFKKFDLHVDAMKVLLENLENLERGEEYANKVDLPEVWSQLAKAYLSQDLVSAAVAAYIKAKYTDDYLAVIDVAKRADDFDSMVKYLVMVRKKVKEPKVDSELCYAYAKTGQLAELEEFISQPNATKLDKVFASHLHVDHVGDFMGLHIGGWLSGRYTPIHLYGPSGATPELGTSAFAEGMKQGYAWDLQTRSGALPDAGAKIEVHEFDYKQMNEVVYAANGVTDSSGRFGYVIYVRQNDYERAAGILDC